MHLMQPAGPTWRQRAVRALQFVHSKRGLEEYRPWEAAFLGQYQLGIRAAARCGRDGCGDTDAQRYFFCIVGGKGRGCIGGGTGGRIVQRECGKQQWQLRWFSTEGVWSKEGYEPRGRTVDLSAISLANFSLPFWRAESSRSGAGHRSKTPSASGSGLAGNEPTEQVKDATEKQEKACGDRRRNHRNVSEAGINSDPDPNVSLNDLRFGG
ncbi:hypothetical protein B0H11DRAFT_2211621 [Mycena galericulata]|nr:hypothetical protein B0H11DRAFT_2211621 [Mycena galericulata]